MNNCENCLFYVDAMPSCVICVAGKRIKEYMRIQHDCKKWVENTTENAEKELKQMEGGEE